MTVEVISPLLNKIIFAEFGSLYTIIFDIVDVKCFLYFFAEVFHESENIFL